MPFRSLADAQDYSRIRYWRRSYFEGNHPNPSLEKEGLDFAE
jgi:hypothetical protein